MIFDNGLSVGLRARPMSESRYDIELDELITDLRAQLEKAIAKKPDNGLQFELGNIELELQVAVQRNKSADMGSKFNFKVLPWFGTEAEAKLHAGSQVGTTHTFKLTLKPIGADGEDQRVSRRRRVDDA